MTRPAENSNDKFVKADGLYFYTTDGVYFYTATATPPDPIGPDLFRTTVTDGRALDEEWNGPTYGWAMTGKLVDYRSNRGAHILEASTETAIEALIVAETQAIAANTSEFFMDIESIVEKATADSGPFTITGKDLRELADTVKWAARYTNDPMILGPLERIAMLAKKIALPEVIPQ